jgi:hypothetical protein
LTHTHYFFSLSSLKEERAGGEEANVYKLEPLTPALPRLDGERELFPFRTCVKMHPLIPGGTGTA